MCTWTRLRLDAGGMFTARDLGITLNLDALDRYVGGHQLVK
jgi:hypothetical protein